MPMIDVSKALEIEPEVGRDLAIPDAEGNPASHKAGQVPDIAQIIAALAAISAGINEGQPAPEIYGLILRQAATLIPYDEASIIFLQAGKVVTGAASGKALIALQRETAGLRLWWGREVLDLLACLDEPPLAQGLADAGIQTLLSLPLLANGVVQGRLTFASRGRRAYTAQHQGLATLLAERAGQAVGTAQLHAAQEEVLATQTQLDALRQDFVATISHDLRTPLTGILGYLELLLSRWPALEDEHRRNLVLRIQSAATRLEHSIADLLLFSNVEYAGLQFRLGDYPMEALVEQAVQNMSKRYRDQLIIVHPAKSRALVHADSQRTIQVLANLLDNAIKYSPEGSPVQIRWRVRRREVEVAVGDHGPGIRPEDVPRLFTRFCTLGHQARPGQVGTGIGLYICRKLVDAMHGRIWLDSTSDRGSVFRFTLPRLDLKPETAST